ncbi:MAG: cardiolipin synthase [Prevotellaceae bacterium]|nr:cardiolipin synthase [Prevotellaceae bacterium]
MALFFSILYYLLLLFYFYVVAACVSVILLDNRNPVKSIAWVVALIMLPVVGLVFYLFFGKDYRKNKIFSQKGLKKIYAKPEYALGLKELITSDIPKHLQKTARLLYKNSGAHLYINTKVEILTGGENAFERIFADIERAKEHIHIEFYIIEDDKIGNELRRLLIRKAQERVRVRVIYDYLGCFRLSDAYIKSLQNAGIFIKPFLPVNRKLGYRKINYRNHRKLVVIDGKIGYTGGINVADRYVSGNRLGKWRDTSVRLEGPAAHGLQNIFLTDWFFVDNRAVTNEKYYPEPNTFSQNVVQLVNSGPDTQWEAILQGIITVFSNARKNIYIHTPYFLPPESLITAMEMAALSGVDVRLMVPARSDTPLASSASSSYFLRILEAGVRIYLYKQNFLHSKAITVDDEIGIVGTANMDIRSFEQNFEVNAFIYDKKTAETLRSAFKADAKFCDEIVLEHWKNRRFIDKIKESLARLFSPIL